MVKAQKKAANYTDRDDQRRPTPERLAKGDFSLVDDPEIAGTQYAMDNAEGMPSAYRIARVIDDRQLDAAKDFERIAVSRLGSPSGRSCLNFDPVGHEAEEDTDREIAAMREWRDLCGMMSMEVLRVLQTVCWQHEAIPEAKHKMLCLGLDITADFYKI